jgi:hypothetical protein
VDSFLSNATLEASSTVPDFPDQESGQDDIFEATNSDPIVDALLLQRDILSTKCNNTTKIKTCLLILVFIGHGQADEKIKVSLGTLRSLGMNDTWRQSIMATGIKFRTKLMILFTSFARVAE